jgi:hypothetical protein
MSFLPMMSAIMLNIILDDDGGNVKYHFWRMVMIMLNIILPMMTTIMLHLLHAFWWFIEKYQFVKNW